MTHKTPARGRGVSALHCLVCLIAVSACVLLAEAKRNNSNSLPFLKMDASAHLGAEYNNIALAIRKGNGFSDPFGVQSGPTAWMPPVLPLVNAALYALCRDDSSLVIKFHLFFQAIVVVIIGLAFLAEAERIGASRLGTIIFLLAVLTHFHVFFQRTHDTGYLAMLVTALWWGMIHVICVKSTTRILIFWGLFGGVCALSSPVLGAVWGIVTAVELFLSDTKAREDVDPEKCRSSWSFTGYGTRIQKIAIPALISVLAVTPWILRNRIVLDRWIPVKSNAQYELWLSNLIDDDGLLDSSLAAVHPFSGASAERDEYVSVGEVAFIAKRGDAVNRLIRDNPNQYVYRVWKRFQASLFFLKPFHAQAENSDVSVLMVVKQLLHPIPAICLLWLLVCRPRYVCLEARLAAMIFLLSLVPYIMISYYERYGDSLVFVKMLIVLYAFQCLAKAKPKSDQVVGISGRDRAVIGAISD